MTEEKSKFDLRFNGSNYKAFKIKLFDYLMLQDLDHTVSDEFETKSITKSKSKDIKSETVEDEKKKTVEDEKKTKVFIRADMKAQAHIRLGLSDKIIELIKDETSARGIISKLDSLYDRQNIVSIALLEE